MCDGETAVDLPLSLSNIFLTVLPIKQYFHYPHALSITRLPLFPSRGTSPSLQWLSHPRAEGDKAATVPPPCPKAPHISGGPAAGVTPAGAGARPGIPFPSNTENFPLTPQKRASDNMSSVGIGREKSNPGNSVARCYSGG